MDGKLNTELKKCVEKAGTGKIRIRMDIESGEIVMLNLSQYKITEIRYSHSRYIMGIPVKIEDEGSFYRIDGSHIIDKARIKKIEIKGNQLILHLANEDIVLIVK